MTRVLFVCLHNAGRSQMSRAFFERYAAGRHQADSAGTTPGKRVHPVVVDVMREVDIDIADRVPQKLTTELAQMGRHRRHDGLRRPIPLHPRHALHRLGA